MANSLRRLNILRTISYGLFLAICIFWVFDSGFPKYINWPITTIGLVLLLQLIFRIRKLDLILGVILTILSFYMVLAVASDLADHFNGTKPVKTFALYFGVGFGIFGTACIAALTIIYVYFSRRRLEENKKALQNV